MVLPFSCSKRLSRERSGSQHPVQPGLGRGLPFVPALLQVSVYRRERVVREVVRSASACT
jgi:hypothetical protein